MPRRKEPHIPDAILDQLLAGADPKTAFDPNGLLDDLKKALAERALIPSPGDQNLWAQSRSPMDMMSQGRSVSLFHASQQWSRMSP